MLFHLIFNHPMRHRYCYFPHIGWWNWDDKYQVNGARFWILTAQLQSPCTWPHCSATEPHIVDKEVSGHLLFCKNLNNLCKQFIVLTLTELAPSWGIVGLIFTYLMYPPPGERLAVVEVQCERLRMLYRDCARPPPPPLQADRRQVSPLCSAPHLLLFCSTEH